MKLKRLTAALILFVYCAILIKVMVFKDVPLIRMGDLMIYFGGSQTGPANLIPFKTILVYMRGEKGLMIGGINLVGNIILLLPVGLLLPFVFRNITWKKVLVLAVAAGFIIEGLQVILRIGIFDIDDVILNGLGVMLGYWTLTVLTKKLHSMKPERVRIAAIIVIFVAAAIACYGLVIYQKGHFPIKFEQGPENRRSDLAVQQKAVGAAVGDDPCGNTGGTGRIVSLETGSIKIKGHDGLDDVIKLTNQTRISSSAGTITSSDLKIGNRVTIVTYESDQDGYKIAVAVLVCNASNPEI